MKRFIRYLYEYEQGKKLRNVGFVKAEQGVEDCVLHIHGKGLNLGEAKVLKLYLFFVEDGECVGIWQGDAENVNPAINYRMYFTSGDTGGRENFDRINGIILESGDGRRFAAVWDEKQPDIGAMRIWDPDEGTREEEPAEKPAEEPAEEMAEEETAEEEAAEEKTLEETEERQEVEDTEEIQISRGGFRCQKIQRNDLARLPRCEWKLSNNSFLLHGYFNYHHLVFLDDGEWLRLGVPGIFHPKEAKAAEAFGFPEFIRRCDIEVDLSEEEQEPEEKFGYWCRCVRRQTPLCPRT